MTKATTPSASDTIETYLNDHLAGATAALQLLDHLVDSAKAAGDADFFAALRAEIAQDRQTLESLLAGSGGRPSALRQLGGWVAEKASRLKLMLDDPTRGTLERLEALEFLALGILGKRALWRALAAAALPAFAGVDFAVLQQRAEDQHDRVEARRLDAARRALRGESAA